MFECGRKKKRISLFFDFYDMIHGKSRSHTNSFWNGYLFILNKLEGSRIWKIRYDRENLADFILFSIPVTFQFFVFQIFLAAPKRVVG